MSIKIGIPYSGCAYISEIPCTREDEAVAFACGMTAGGAKDVTVFMQDNGFLLALDVILGLHVTYDIDIQIAVNNRTEPIHHLLTGLVWFNMQGMFNDAIIRYRNYSEQSN